MNSSIQYTKTSPAFNFRFYLALAGWWFFWALVQCTLMLLLGTDKEIALLDTALNMTLLATSSLILINILRFYSPGLRSVLIIFIWSLVLSGISVYIHLVIFTSTASENTLDVVGTMISTLVLRLTFAWLTLNLVVIMCWVWLLINEQSETFQRNHDMQQMLAKAELYSLRQQLQPHFLFNSLNSVNALIGTKPEDARRMIHQLSDFLRGTINREEGQLVKLRDELAQLELYLEIEKVRFGHRLQTSIQMEEGCLELKLPALILQPIVENAIKFGLYQTTEDASISISGKIMNGMLVIMITNPYDSENIGHHKGTGFGLESIRRRLYLLYASSNLLEVDRKDNIFTTTLKIPQT